jgi:hypothetical protein
MGLSPTKTSFSALLSICRLAAVWTKFLDSEMPWWEFELSFQDRFTEVDIAAISCFTRCRQDLARA